MQEIQAQTIHHIYNNPGPKSPNHPILTYTRKGKTVEKLIYWNNQKELAKKNKNKKATWLVNVGPKKGIQVEES